jgi:dihydroneopterin aldolase
VRIEVSAIVLHGRHGVLDEERRDGQRFRFDVALEVQEPTRDEIDETVDYRDIVACVREVSDGRAYQLLEALVAAVADELMVRFAPLSVTVRVGKPDLLLEGGAAATVSATRPSA